MIQYHPQQSLSKGVDALNNMYKSLSDESPVKAYLTEHASDLLTPLEGDTPVSESALLGPNLLNNPLTVNLGSSYSLTYTNHPELQKTAGVYVFTDSTGEVVQCGSCINWQSRMALHYQENKASPKPLYNPFPGVGLEAYHWTPVAIITNHLSDYLLKNNLLLSELSLEDQYILRSFTQQRTRSLEQAISYYCKPRYWNGADIITWHNKWEPGYVVNDDGNLTTWVDQKGSTFSADSMRKASSDLGISLRTVGRSANCVPAHWIYSPKYGKVTLLVEGRPKQPLPQVAEGTRLGETAFDTSTLTYNKVYVVNSDLVVLPYGPFDSVADANEELGFERSHRNRRYLNKAYLINAPLLEEKVYLVSNRTRIKYQHLITATDIVSNVVISFPSMAEAQRFFFGAANLKAYKQLDKAMIQQSVIPVNGKEYRIAMDNSQDMESRLAIRKAITRERNQRYYAKVSNK